MSDTRRDEPFRYVFGPAISRRLGRSLGVDLVPFKTCTYDCVYCQLGSTTDKTVKRDEYVPLEGVLAEVERKLAQGVKTDYITLAGSGEPTLYSRLGAFVKGVKARCTIPLAVITNGSLFWDPQVRADLAEADLVIPSLDAGTPEAFRSVNRPHDGIDFERMVEGLAAFRRESPNLMWLEILLVDELTANDDEIEHLTRHVARIRPDRVQLTTVVRPPMAGGAEPVPVEALTSYLQAFERVVDQYGGTVEVVAHYGPQEDTEGVETTPADVLDLLRRHPCSTDDIATGLGIHPNEAIKHISRLLEQEAVSAELLEGVAMYVALGR